MTEDEMFGGYHLLNGHEFEKILGASPFPHPFGLRDGCMLSIFLRMSLLIGEDHDAGKD